MCGRKCSRAAKDVGVRGAKSAASTIVTWAIILAVVVVIALIFSAVK